MCRFVRCYVRNGKNFRNENDSVNVYGVGAAETDDCLKIFLDCETKFPFCENKIADCASKNRVCEHKICNCELIICNCERENRVCEC